MITPTKPPTQTCRHCQGPPTSGVCGGINECPAPGRHGCRLVIERNIAPPDRWHWAVLTPTGHVYAVSEYSYARIADAIADADEFGADKLRAAEKAVEPRAAEGLNNNKGGDGL